ncbi:hypothetical protein ACE10Z_09850 [Bradyrhizobium sp. Pha-3]
MATTLPDVICTASDKRGADVRPNFNWDAKGPIGGMGYRVLSMPCREA